MDLYGEKVILKTLTRELCHEVFKNYVSDPMMTDKIYQYSKEEVDHYFNERNNDSSRKLFAIVVDGKAIGEVQIKYINYILKKGNVGIHLINDSVKGKGYGTEAQKLIIEYAFEDLKLNTIYADTVIRNTRSQHILQKLGFQYTYEDDILKLLRYRFYKIEYEKSDSTTCITYLV